MKYFTCDVYDYRSSYNLNLHSDAVFFIDTRTIEAAWCYEFNIPWIFWILYENSKEALGICDTPDLVKDT